MDSKWKAIVAIGLAIGALGFSLIATIFKLAIYA